MSLIVAAHDEEAVIAAKVANALGLDYPRERLELIVACDGCTDATAARASEAGADLVLELPRGGKIRAQDAAVERASGEIVAFSDANALWEPGRGAGARRARSTIRASATRAGRFASCGPPSSEGGWTTKRACTGATSWRCVRWSRGCARSPRGNGAIYATRRDSYLVVDPVMGHDLSLPFNMVKRGLRAVYVPSARASEKMVPSIGGEFARKRRMMSHTWPILLRGGMLSPRGYPPGYALMILSHRVLRYATPALHVLALATNVALVALGAGCRVHRHARSPARAAARRCARRRAAGQAAAARPLLRAHHGVARGRLWDWLRHGTEATWDAAEGTR